MYPMLVTLETSQLDKTLLKEEALMNILYMLDTLETSQPDTSPVKAAALPNM
jgi:hypothetical protein